MRFVGPHRVVLRVVVLRHPAVQPRRTKRPLRVPAGVLEKRSWKTATATGKTVARMRWVWRTRPAIDGRQRVGREPAEGRQRAGRGPRRAGGRPRTARSRPGTAGLGSGCGPILIPDRATV